MHSSLNTPHLTALPCVHLCVSCCNPAGALRTLPPSKWDQLNTTMSEVAATNQEFTTTTGNTAVAPSEVMKTINKSISLFQDNSVFTLGQNAIYPGAPVCNSDDAAAIKQNAKVPCQSPPIVGGGKGKEE